MRVLVTQSESFLGKNLIENLKNIKNGKNRTRPNLSINEICKDFCDDPDFVFVLPGNNDWKRIQDFLKEQKEAKFAYISTLKGSKEEKYFINEQQRSYIFRYPMITGKWQTDECEIAKLCISTANDEEMIIDNPNRIVELLFVDDFVNEMLDWLEDKVCRCDFPIAGTPSIDPTAPYDGATPLENKNGQYCFSKNTFKTPIGCIANHLKNFNNMNYNFLIPEMPENSLVKKLFSMYLSYLPEKKMCYSLKMNVDNRGIFTEIFKTRNNGQVSINIARPHNTRGQHWHNSKWEIFVVVSGHGLIEERKIDSDVVHSFEVFGEDMKAIIMLPGYTHSITNLEQDKDLVTVMFANEEFNTNYPDTYFEQV